MLVHLVYLVYLVCLVRLDRKFIQQNQADQKDQPTRQTNPGALHEHRRPSSLPSPVPSSLESDAAGLWRGLRHQFTNGLEDDTKLAIVLFLKI